MESYEEFRSQFTNNKSGKFWQTITKNSSVPLTEIPKKEDLLKKLYEEIVSSSYKPSDPRAYIMINKGFSIARTLPVFAPKDICYYYYYTKKIEPLISGNRIPGTFGGWSLNGIVRKAEELEKSHTVSSLREYEMPDGSFVGLDESEEYSVPASFNPKAWMAEWKDYNKTLYTMSRGDVYDSIAELDIANFYDNINVDVLEEKLKISGVDPDDIARLLYFLKNWGGYTNTAKTSHKGIPQDEVADCSRLIANYYLQDFDEEMYALCQEYGAKYFRYADDQIIMARSQKDLHEIIAKASLKILRHGLCFNHAKSKLMTKTEFEEHFSFDWFIEHSEKTTVDEETFQKELSYYKDNTKRLRNNGISVFLRLLGLSSVGISKGSVESLYEGIVNLGFLTSPKLKVWHLKRLFDLMDDNGQARLCADLDEYSETQLHNSYHYTLLGFYKTIGRDTGKTQKRIKVLEEMFKL